MLIKINNKILNYLEKLIIRNKIKKLIKNYSLKEKVIYFQTPEHGNLGDQAIAIAGRKIIEKKHKNKLVLEFSFAEYKGNEYLLKKLIRKSDYIYIHGGGNFGNLYPREENQRRSIIKNFTENKIISMPQSLYYTDDENGKKELKITKKILNNHKDLTIIARDEKSFNFGKKEFELNKIVMAPDSVLFLEDYYLKEMDNNRDGVIFTLRQDKEKVLSNEKIEEIKKILKRNNINFRLDDTTVPYDIDIKRRDYEVNNILKKISNSKLNITDRFHGVIFSVITNTPVLVFKSLDHKISEGIKWFNKLNYVHYITSADNLEEIIKKYTSSDEIIKKNKFELKERLEDIFFKL